jgi:hypothetical protein
VRDADFASAVLDDPVEALRDYGLTPDELDDFLALQRHRHEAAPAWAALRAALPAAGTSG